MSSEIARRLVSIREKGAMRSADVASLLGVRPETVSRWNQGKTFPRPDAQKNLLALEFVVDELSHLYEPQEARQFDSGRPGGERTSALPAVVSGACWPRAPAHAPAMRDILDQVETQRLDEAPDRQGRVEERRAPYAVAPLRMAAFH